jgi:hypothetical protein
VELIRAELRLALETLSLARPVQSEDIRVDPQATAFYAQIRDV